MVRTSQRTQAPPVNLKERIAAFQQRNEQQRQNTTPNLAPSASHIGGLRDKIARFEQKGGVPVPRGSFGLGAPPISDSGQTRKKGELYGNRIPGVMKPTTPLSRSGSPLPSSTPERRNHSNSDACDPGTPEFSPPYTASVFASSQSSSPPPSPSFSNTPQRDTDYSTSNSSFSPRKASFANALEIARRAESASLIGKSEPLEAVPSRPVSPYLVQRLPSSMLLDEDEQSWAPKKSALSRTTSISSADNRPPSPLVIDDATIDQYVSAPPPSHYAESPPTALPEASPPPAASSLLPVETHEVTHMSFEEMVASFGDGEPSPHVNEHNQLPVEEHAQESIMGSEDDHLVDSVLKIEDLSVADDRPPNDPIETPDITVVSFDDLPSTPDVPEKDLAKVSVSSASAQEETMPVVEVDEQHGHVPGLVVEVPPVLDEDVPTPVPPPAPEIASHPLPDIPNEKATPPGITRSLSVSPIQVEAAPSPNRSSMDAEESQAMDSVEEVPNDPVIREYQTWQTRLPELDVEAANNSVAYYVSTSPSPSVAHPEPEPHDENDRTVTRDVAGISNSPTYLTIVTTPPRSVSTSDLPSPPLFSPSPSLSLDFIHLSPESPVRPRAISMVEQSEAKAAVARRISSRVDDGNAVSPDTPMSESEFGTVSLQTYPRSYSHPHLSFASPDEEAGMDEFSQERVDKPFSFSAIVYGKVTERPSTSYIPPPNSRSTPTAPQTANSRLAPSRYVEPESPGYVELAELLKEAARLEKRLLEGDIPSEHRAAARQSLLAMNKYTAAQERMHSKPKSSARPGDQLPRPVFHRASSSPSAAKTPVRARSRDSALPNRAPGWRDYVSGKALPLPEIQAPTGPYTRVDAPPTPPPKSPRPRYFSNLKKLASGSMSGTHRSASISTASISSEDSHGVLSSGSHERDGKGGHQRNGTTLGIGWPSMSPKKGGSIGRATAFAEKIWKRRRTKSTTSLSEVFGMSSRTYHH
jgi:hypothetical protein